MTNCDVFLFLLKIWIGGTRKTPCTHNLCFELNKKEIIDFLSSENYHFYSCEISQYIVRVCYRNVKLGMQCNGDN